MVNFREENPRKKFNSALEWFRSKGLDARMHMEDLATPFMKEALKKSR